MVTSTRAGARMSELDRNSPVPLYAQLADILRSRIARGDWGPGEKIPSENELNALYGLSRMTVRGVITALVHDGLLFRVPGKGTFVAPEKIDTIPPAYRGVREQLEQAGYETSTRLLSSELETPSERVRERLGLGPADLVVAVHRVRSARDIPVSLHRTWVPAALAPGLEDTDTVSAQLCKVLEHDYGLAMKHVDEQLESTALSAEEAALLETKVGSPALLLRDLIHDTHGRAFEYSQIVFRGDLIRLRFDYDL